MLAEIGQSWVRVGQPRTNIDLVWWNFVKCWPTREATSQHQAAGFVAGRCRRGHQCRATKGSDASTAFTLNRRGSTSACAALCTRPQLLLTATSHSSTLLSVRRALTDTRHPSSLLRLPHAHDSHLISFQCGGHTKKHECIECECGPALPVLGALVLVRHAVHLLGRMRQPDEKMMNHRITTIHPE